MNFAFQGCEFSGREFFHFGGCELFRRVVNSFILGVNSASEGSEFSYFGCECIRGV